MGKLFMKTYIKIILGIGIFLIILITLLFSYGFLFGKAKRVSIIEDAFPVLEKHQVTSYEVRRNCKRIVIGDYENSTYYADKSCPHSPDDAKDFDQNATQIYREIKNSLRGSRVNYFFNLLYEDGKLRKGYFNYQNFNFWDYHFLLRTRYVYQPGHHFKSYKKPACLGELDEQKINDDWYFECEDWN